MLTIDKLKVTIVYTGEKRLTYRQKSTVRSYICLNQEQYIKLGGGQKRGSEKFFLMEGIKMTFEGKIILKLKLDKWTCIAQMGQRRRSL